MSGVMPSVASGAKRASLGARGRAVSDMQAHTAAQPPVRLRRRVLAPHVWQAGRMRTCSSHVVCSAGAAADAAQESPDVSARHVAIIMDGNTRWSIAKGQPVAAGHAAGAAALTRVVRRACAVGLRELTVFAFCADNWRRPADEVAGLFSVMHSSLDAHLAELSSAGVKLSVIGDTCAVPQPLAAALRAAQGATSGNTGLHLTVAINYSGTRHVAAAVRAVAAQVAEGNMRPGDVDETVFGAFMATCGQYADGGSGDGSSGVGAWSGAWALAILAPQVVYRCCMGVALVVS